MNPIKTRQDKKDFWIFSKIGFLRMIVATILNVVGTKLLVFYNLTAWYIILALFLLNNAILTYIGFTMLKNSAFNRGAQ